MTKMLARGTAAILTILILTALILTGCKNSDTGLDSPGKGRYVENDLELPLEDGEQLISFSESKDGNPLLFSIHYIVEDGVQMEVKRYEYQDGEWEGKAVEWFAEMYGGHIASSEAVDMKEASDGTQVLLMKEQQTFRYFLLRGNENMAGEEPDIPYFSQKDGDYYSAASELVLDKNGNYWIGDGGSGLAVISSGTLETLLELETVYPKDNLFPKLKVMAGGQDGSVAVLQEEGEYTIFDADSLKESSRIRFGKDDWPRICSDGSNWYGVSKSGISRTRPGNEISEIILNPSMGIMGSPLYGPSSMVMGADEDFYVLYGQKRDYTYSLKHYVYDSDIAAVPDKVLTVFGLSENDTVREAIQGFQKENPDILVDFHTSGKSKDEVTTDDIRTLNTELLSGNGSDVLLMDGLPLDSYMEKGMLEDLTDLTEELTAKERYMENILRNTAEKDGKIYGLPVKFTIPVMYGDKTIQEALSSLDTLKAYLVTYPDASVFGIADHRYIKNVLFQLYQDEIIEPDGKINQEKLAVLLELVERITENAQSESVEELNHITAKDLEEVDSPFYNYAEWALLKYKDAVSTNEISGVMDMSVPFEVMRQSDLEPVNIQNLYHPVGIAAVNQNSSQKETAKAFIQYLMSEEIQSVQTDDGFPVLESALQSRTDEVGTLYMKTTGIGGLLKTEDGDIEIMTFGKVTKEEVLQLIGLSRTLTRALRQDRVVLSIYEDYEKQYLEGSIEADEAARKIAQKVDTYLAE